MLTMRSCVATYPINMRHLGLSELLTPVWMRFSPVTSSALSFYPVKRHLSACLHLSRQLAPYAAGEACGSQVAPCCPDAERKCPIWRRGRWERVGAEFIWYSLCWKTLITRPPFELGTLFFPSGRRLIKDVEKTHLFIRTGKKANVLWYPTVICASHRVTELINSYFTCF